jgi:dGTP triphosphohydrolase
MNKTYREFLFENEILDSDITDILDSQDVEYEKFDDYIEAEIPSKDVLISIIEKLPDDLDFEVYDIEDSEQDDEIEVDDIDELEGNDFTLVIYTYNLSDEDQIDEVKRIIKVNNKGKKRIKMKCRKGFKWTGSKCVKISGKELTTKKRAIRKAVRTKKAKGAGFKRKRARLWRKAMRKRKSFVGKRR